MNDRSRQPREFNGFRNPGGVRFLVFQRSVECASERAPRHIMLRLPHASGARAARASGAKHDRATETVLVEHFTGRAEMVLTFD